jgi:hypothetical protein
MVFEGDGHEGEPGHRQAHSHGHQLPCDPSSHKLG